MAKPIVIKMYQLRFWAILIILPALTCKLQAQNVSFTGEAPNAVHSGEQFQLTYTLNENVDDFTPPDFGSFQFLGGPSTGSSTSVQILNGHTSSSSSYTFTYYLQAPAAGKYTLPPATATYKKSKIQSNSIEIEVVGNSQAAANAALNNANQNPKESQEVSGNGDVFLRLEIDKKTAYVGEALTAEVKLYTKVQISGLGTQNYKGPDFVNFYKQEIPIQQISFQRGKVGNDIYDVATLSKAIIFPQRGGEITIQPFDLVVEVQKQVRRRSQSIFDDFFGSPYQRSQLSVKSQAVKIVVKPLPSNQPTDFKGAVGKFSINATANPTNIRTNDAVTFKITLSGKGNIKLLEGLKADFPPTFEVYEPIIKTNIENTGLSGSKVFEYTAIPRHAGRFSIPPFTISYFDVNEKSYKTISTQNFEINVDKGANDSNTFVVNNLSKEDIALIGSDIRYIETKSDFKRKAGFFFGSFLFYLVFIAALLVFILTLIIRNEQIKRSADIVRMRNRKAGRVAGQRLKKAHQLMKSHNKEAFYEEIGRTLWGYLSDKLGIPVAELSKERIALELSHSGIDTVLTEQFFDLSELSEFARFAPGGIESNMSDIFEKAENLISKLDQNL
jgi:hypothetical protein